jgi:preprotein translocase subunit SecY
MGTDLKVWRAIYTANKTRLHITILALLFYWLGYHIPMPGLPEITNVRFQNSANYSIFSYGMSSWVTVLGSIELLILLFGKQLGFLATPSGHVNPFGKWVIFFALIYTFWMGWSFLAKFLQIAQANETAIHFLDLVFPLISMLAGTSTIIFLASVIETRGVKFGFWILIAVGGLQRWAYDTAKLPSLFIERRLDFKLLGFDFLVFIICFAAIIALLIFRQKNSALASEKIWWPIVVSGYLASWIFAGVALITPEYFAVITAGHSFLLYRFLSVVIEIGLLWFYLRGEQRRLVTHLTVGIISMVIIVQAVAVFFSGLIFRMETLTMLLATQAALWLWSIYCDEIGSKKLKTLWRSNKS